MDTIQLRGLRVLGTHGLLPEERERAQPFEVDLDVDVDLSSAGASDDLEHTLDYGELAKVVASVVAGESHGLLERIGERIADDVLASDARVNAVTVAVWKLRPPLAADLARAGVRITRTRRS